jgi:uncharacterized protein
MARVDKPLSDAEYTRIAVMLDRSRGKGAMNLEMLDGFFAALICSPDMSRPGEYLREIWGGDRIGGDKGWRDEEEMQEFFDLIMRHWDSVARVLTRRRKVGRIGAPFRRSGGMSRVRAGQGRSSRNAVARSRCIEP